MTLDPVHRILDANFNRAREAARVVEDYCRFVLDDALLSRELKALRHALVDALGELPPAALLQARDTPGDVGTAVTVESEARRDSVHHVVQANLKRLQESLRSLEEYGKRHSALLGARFEDLRYRTYVLEKAIVPGAAVRERLSAARLCVLVSDSACHAGLETAVREAIDGGADMIQLREKECDDRDLLVRARAVRQWTREADVLFNVNDRPDIARLADADGVHLGQEDMRVADARRIVGPDALIGVSTHSIEQVRQAILDGASYIGVGPTFPSATKDFEQLAGLNFVRQVKAETSLPAFAIGGISVENVGQVVEAGLNRVAVSHAICGSENPEDAARAIKESLTVRSA